MKNYFIVFEHVSCLRKILDLDLNVFGLKILIMLHFTGFGLEIFWTAIYNYTFLIVMYLTGSRLENIYLDYEFGLRLLDFTGFELGNVWTAIFDYN